ncbi:hypothetical protein ACI2K4_21935 [Micromonospora sp. NPDC050397]|uniref:hypothetical protein n=1 Tax=Micromonospora sp. NPDC050397 TaxID=3364279 RepID=UPI00384F1150
MTSPSTPLAQAGDVVRIAAADYFDGTTPVTVRIAQIGPDLDKITRLEWIHVLVTDPERPEATPGQPDPGRRRLIVRAAALRQPQIHLIPKAALPPESARRGLVSASRIPSPRRPADPTVGSGTATQLIPSQSGQVRP